MTIVKYFATLLVSAALNSACSTTSVTATHSTTHGAISGLPVYVDAAQLPKERENACNAIAGDRIAEAPKAAKAAGMLEAEFIALRDTTASQHIIASFRDSNQSCLPHLAAGVQSKPHAVLQKTWERSNLLPKDEQLAGLVSTLMKKPPKDVKITEPQLTLYNGTPVTCDYDLMDLAETDGTRIPGESTRELAIRTAFNSSIPTTPQGHRDRIMHGSQAGYGQYIEQHGNEEVITALFKPEAPLTAFTGNGTVFRLQSLEHVINFYHCYGIMLLPKWDVETAGAGERARIH